MFLIHCGCPILNEDGSDFSTDIRVEKIEMNVEEMVYLAKLLDYDEDAVYHKYELTHTCPKGKDGHHKYTVFVEDTSGFEIILMG